MIPERRLTTSAPTRRQIREQERSNRHRARHRTRGGAARWAARVAVLAALGSATTAAPLTGFTSPGEQEPVPEQVVLAEQSALDVLGQPRQQESPALSAVQSLSAEETRSARAMAAASRSASRDAPACGLTPPANGWYAAEATPIDVVRPLPQGEYRQTSRYGYRTHPIFGNYAMHDGVDLAAAADTPIRAIADGEVTYVGQGRDGRSAMLIIVEHEIDGERVWSWYIHMYPAGVYVEVGEQVSAGEVIGSVGSYGNSTGPHLHVEIHLDENLTTVDPNEWLEQNGAVPLDEETLACLEG